MKNGFFRLCTRFATPFVMLSFLLFAGSWRGLSQVPFTCEDQFFMTFTTPPSTLNEVVINAQSNVEFRSINNNLGIIINAAGYRSTDNFIYCIAPVTQQLIRLDANGGITVLAQLPLNPLFAYFAGDITPDGRFMVLIGTGTLPTGQNVASELVRIDLDSPTFALTRTPISTGALIFDIAFNPITGQLYGYDSNGLRLVRINENTGAISFSFPSFNAPGITGSIFFDAFGRLYAYGSANSTNDIQNRLFEIDPDTGFSRLMTNGPTAEATDGCSCPYTVQLTKSVNRESVYPCNEIEYTFTIANTSGRTQQGLRLDDALPAGFTFVRVSSNPLTSALLSQTGDNRFVLDNMQVPVGKHEIKIIVRVGNTKPGEYKNQARLLNLPQSLGNTRVSDDPSTIIKSDSTSILVLGLPFQELDLDTTLCDGTASLLLDAGKLTRGLGDNITYTWQDGSKNETFTVRAAGQYRVGVTAGCDTIWINYKVRSSGIIVSLKETFFEKNLGDSAYVETIVTLSNSSSAFYQWLDPQPGSVRCATCDETWIQAFNDLTYIVRAENEYGCWDTASVKMKVIKNYNVYFPNAIKPETALEPSNGIFTGFGDPATQLQRISVFSRWGELMFENRNITLNDLNAGWDGRFRGEPVPPGVYVWTAKVAFLDGLTAEYSGDVTVIR